MKLIILAAGQGTRLRPITDDRPKVLVELNGQSILEWQIHAARAAGLHEIVVVGGYCAAKLESFDVELVVNGAYATTNMVQSLFCARQHFDTDFIMAYGDIIYTPEILKRLMNSSDAISVVVDTQWRSYWESRFEDPLADAESLKMDPQGFITSIGQKVKDMEEIEAQYIGLVRFEGLGVRQLEGLFDQAVSEGLVNQASGQRLDVNRMYMTDLLQAMAHRDGNLKALKTPGGWLEIDSRKDLEIASLLVRNGKLGR